MGVVKAVFIGEMELAAGGEQNQSEGSRARTAAWPGRRVHRRLGPGRLVESSLAEASHLIHTR